MIRRPGPLCASMSRASVHTGISVAATQVDGPCNVDGLSRAVEIERDNRQKEERGAIVDESDVMRGGEEGGGRTVVKRWRSMFVLRT
jgi:hypothetical protein